MAAILIISRNNAHLTKAAVRTALAQTVPCEVLVLDNASTDGTTAWLRSKEHPHLHTGGFMEQRSLAACWNFGLKLLFNQGHNTVLVCNNDVELRPDTYHILDKGLIGSMDCGIVTAVSVDSRDRMGQVDDRDFLTIWESRREHPDFSCFMIHKSCVEIVGQFNEDYYPAYCEDSDYHVRMHRKGAKAVCVDLPFYHAAAQTVKQADAGEQARIKRGADVNRERFRRIYGCTPGSKEYEALFTI